MKKENRMCILIVYVLITAVALLSGCVLQQGRQEEQPEVFKLTVSTDAAHGDWNNYWLIQTIEKKFNVDIQVEMIFGEGWSDRLPLMFTAEEFPDFFLGSLNSSEIATYGSKGYLLDLSPYITEKTTPNIWAAFEETPALKSAVKEPDGKIYCLNGADMAEFNLAQNRFYINYKWAEEILGKQPETLVEFYEYLKGVKERDMNGNGDADDEIPLGGAYNTSNTIHIFTPILGAFGFTSREIDVIDGKVIYVPAEDNYKYFLEFMNRLYKEELLDNEYFSQTQDQADVKAIEYRYGAYGDWASWVNQPDENIWRQYDIMEPLVSQYNSEKKAPAADINKCGEFIITTYCKNPEKLMEIADWCFTFEGYLAILAGFEKGTVKGQEEFGYTYKWVDEKTLDVRTYFDENKYSNTHQWRLAEISPNYGTIPIYRNFNTAGTGDPQSYLDEGLIKHLAPYYHVGWPSSVKFTTEELDELALIFTDIQSYTDDTVTKMIMGLQSIDEFENFREELRKRRLDRMIEIYQKAYNRWLADQ